MGNIWVYEVEEEVITVTVLDETRDILGIESIVVRHVVEEDGELVEDTFDWYAQDSDGNVWYRGELSRDYEDGELSDIDGPWEAGVAGAKAGSCSGACLQNLKYTPIEPGEQEYKYYKPGTGMILETKPGSDERLELVDFTPGS